MSLIGQWRRTDLNCLRPLNGFAPGISRTSTRPAQPARSSKADKADTPYACSFPETLNSGCQTPRAQIPEAPTGSVPWEEWLIAPSKPRQALPLRARILNPAGGELEKPDPGPNWIGAKSRAPAPLSVARPILVRSTHRRGAAAGGGVTPSSLARMFSELRSPASLQRRPPVRSPPGKTIPARFPRRWSSPAGFCDAWAPAERAVLHIPGTP